MSNTIYNILTVLLSLCVLYSIHLMNNPKTAVRGNALGALALTVAVVVTLVSAKILTLPILWVSMFIGSAIGTYFAVRVTMIQMPQVVALLNGFSGGSAAVVALLMLTSLGVPELFGKLAAGQAILIGPMTFSASLVAAGKLHGKLPQKPIVLPRHSMLCGSLIAAGFLLWGWIALDSSPTPFFATSVLFTLSLIFGVLFSIRVGGADMPITISLLNALTGIAGALAGMVVADPLLVAVGGIVGAAGLLLTRLMCKAMNRNLMSILLGQTAKSSVSKAVSSSTLSEPVQQKTTLENIVSPMEFAASVLARAQKVIIVPGYGMALAQAQHTVKSLADLLESRGADVAYAIHPVAGRMPGHMNVLLAEADVDYEKLLEMDAANPLFADSDVVLVVGANDVINPAAKEAEGTPIYGMPVLDVSDAPHVIICNYDAKPGYAGVENPLYTREGVLLLEGDAARTVDEVKNRVFAVRKDSLENFSSTPDTSESIPVDSSVIAAEALSAAKRVIIVPGYGMALAQAQHAVKALVDTLESKDTEVVYAIHPVAGRMPGHMNVLLAEVDVDYEKMLEMDTANPLFADCDAVLIVGANDVVNPAAKEAEGTPIYGMPILDVMSAPCIIICNYDTKPGYAGVNNPLYERESSVLLLGDAADTLKSLTGALTGLSEACGIAAERASGSAEGKDPLDQAASILRNAAEVIVVPGYGMALAQAQHHVKGLADLLESKGTQISYAIHPVAGRMPGHMNVLLAEAGVDYEKLLEMDVANPLFATCDAVLVVGANDVINPAARSAEGTPIYGMPILDVINAPQAVICNYDTKPGYAGVENPLYAKDGVVLLLGDASSSLKILTEALR